jgi:hypothetical protein
MSPLFEEADTQVGTAPKLSPSPNTQSQCARSPRKAAAPPSGSTRSEMGQAGPSSRTAAPPRTPGSHRPPVPFARRTVVVRENNSTYNKGPQGRTHSLPRPRDRSFPQPAAASTSDSANGASTSAIAPAGHFAVKPPPAVAQQGSGPIANLFPLTPPSPESVPDLRPAWVRRTDQFFRDLWNKDALYPILRGWLATLRPFLQRAWSAGQCHPQRVILAVAGLGIFLLGFVLGRLV